MPDVTDIPAMPDLPEAVVPTVDDDRDCVGCAYNLRGLQVTGTCPECGSPVEQSLLGNELWYSDPQWLKSIQWGMTLMVALTIGHVVWHSAVHFLEIDFVYDALGLYITGMIILSGTAVLLVCLITAREPRTLGKPTRAWMHITIRTLLITAHVGGGVVGIVMTTTEDIDHYIIASGLFGLFILCSAVGSILLLFMLRGYAKRMHARLVANWLLFHVVTSAVLGVPLAVLHLYDSVAYFADWDAEFIYDMYVWVSDFRLYAFPIDGLILLPLVIIYHHKLGHARRRALAMRTI